MAFVLCVGQYMPSQAAFVSESLATHFTHMVPLACVGRHMLLQVERQVEHLLTHIAHQVSLSVNHSVFPQLSEGIKSLVAQFTRIIFVLAVHKLVLLEVPGSGESLVTDVTLVALVLCVGQLVSVQGTNTTERLLTHTTCMVLCGGVIKPSMQQAVPFETAGVNKGLATHHTHMALQSCVHHVVRRQVYGTHERLVAQFTCLVFGWFSFPTFHTLDPSITLTALGQAWPERGQDSGGWVWEKGYCKIRILPVFFLFMVAGLQAWLLFTTKLLAA
jgi:hypothetical protein